MVMCIWTYIAELLRGYIFQKLILAWKFYCINKNCFFVKETDTFGHIVVWTTYISHIDHFTPQHTAFEQSAACLSVFLDLLPGLIPLTMLWHAGWTLEKTICMNMAYNYSTTIFRSFFPKMYKFLVENYKFSIFAYEFSRSNWDVRCISCSYSNVAKGICLLDIKAILVYTGIFSCK